MYRMSVELENFLIVIKLSILARVLIHPIKREFAFDGCFITVGVVKALGD